MIPIVVLTLTLAAFVLALVRPKVGGLLIWPVLMCYPHGYWHEHSPLPLGVTLDDVMVLGAVAALAIHRGGLRMGWAVYMVLAYAGIIALANTIGLLRFGSPDELALLIALREVIKTLVFAAVACIIVSGVETWEEMHRLTWAVCLGLFLGALTVPISNYDVEFAQDFGSAVKDVHYESAAYRPAGAFGEPNSVGGVMVAGMPMVLMLIQNARGLRKVVPVAGAALMALALLFSRSRSGALGLLALVPAVLFLKSLRAWALLAFLGITVVVVCLPGLSMPVLDRLTGSFDPNTSELSGTEGSRLDIWVRHLSNLDSLSLITGKGQGVARWLADGVQPHNGFLDLLCYYGIWGGIWVALLITGFLKRVQMLRHSDVLEANTLGNGALLFIIILPWLSLWSDTFAPGAYDFLILAMFMAVIDRAVSLPAADALPVWPRSLRLVEGNAPLAAE